MTCDAFGRCGSCRLFDKTYDEQLEFKATALEEAFASHLSTTPLERFATTDGGFRNRAEFKIWHDKEHESIHYAMRRLDDSKSYGIITSCTIVSPAIQKQMAAILPLVQSSEILRFKLFEMDFLSTSDGETLITLIYHKKLDENWVAAARELKEKLGCDIIGRSRGSKIVLDKDYVTETVHTHHGDYRLRHIENTFTQPNGDINQKIIGFLSRHTEGSGDDLLELYCGMGNLTLPLAKNFRKVLGIEVAKSSIHAGRENLEANGIENVTFARMSAEEFTQAYTGVRSFERLREVDLASYQFGTVLVDPPRSGLDPESLELVRRFDKVLYISCNPETLLENLNDLASSHRVAAAAVFDQFAYTPHMEMGVILQKK